MDTFNTAYGETSLNPDQEYATVITFSGYRRGVCPQGWHIPSREEWITLINYLTSHEEYSSGGVNTYIAKALVSTNDWESNETHNTVGNNLSLNNVSGFSTLPVGYWQSFGELFSEIGYSASIWSSNHSNNIENAWSLVLNNSSTNAGVFEHNRRQGLSVRYVRDEAVYPTNSLSIISQPESATIELCNNTGTEVTYTATIPNDNTSDYSYVWTVNQIEQSSTSSTLNYTYTTTGTFVVNCTATKNDIVLTAAKTTTVGLSGSTPSITVCNDDLNVTLKSVNNVASVFWGDGQSDNAPAESTTHAYASAGNYTITVYSNSGCTVTELVALTVSTLLPCSGLTAHQGNGYINNGFNNANDGYEQTNSEGIVSATDYDGNVYPVVKIGSQCWIAENLRCTHSPKSGNYIVNPNATPNQTYMSKVANWSHIDSANSVIRHFGLVYNWCAAMDTVDSDASDPESVNFVRTGNHRGICPKGYHIPNEDEWTSLLNSSTVGGNLAKLSKGCDWAEAESTGNIAGNYNYLERNSSGFGALPVAFADWIGGYVFFRSSDRHSGSTVCYIRWNSFDTEPERANTSKGGCIPVRCLRD